MKIEPEALYTLFETLILTDENKSKEDETQLTKKEVNNLQTDNIIIEHKGDKIQTEVKVQKRLTLFFSNKPDEEDEELLKKILGAIQISELDYEKFYNVNFDIMMELISANKGFVLIWGLTIPGIEKYKLTKYRNSTLLISDPLQLIKTDLTLKTALWKCLKSAFVQNK